MTAPDATAPIILSLIAREPDAVRVRIHVIAEVLRDLVARSGHEAELALTLVMAEIADATPTANVLGATS